jgi:hypothetical protein
MALWGWFPEDIHSEVAASMGYDGTNASFSLHSLFFLLLF